MNKIYTLVNNNVSISISCRTNIPYEYKMLILDEIRYGIFWNCLYYLPTFIYKSKTILK